MTNLHSAFYWNNLKRLICIVHIYTCLYYIINIMTKWTRIILYQKNRDLISTLKIRLKEKNELSDFSWRNQSSLNLQLYSTCVIISFAAGYTILCDWRFYRTENIIMHIVPKKHFFEIFLQIQKHSFQNF